MKFFEIENEFNEKVRFMLNNGWSFNLGTMSGSQGAQGRVDLRKDGRIVRVLLNQHWTVHGDVWSVIVGECEDELVKSGKNDIIWNDKLKVLAQNDYYNVSHHGKPECGWFVGKAEAEVVMKKRRERNGFEDNLYVVLKSKKVLKSAYHVLKKKSGCKGVRLNEIVEVRHCVDGSYLVKGIGHGLIRI